MKPLKSFLKSLWFYPNMFILGAGASHGIVSTTNELKNNVINDWLNMGGYGILNEKKGDTFKRVIGDSYLLHKSSYIIDLLPSNSLDWLISYELSKTENGYKYYQYSMFLFLPGKSIILSFNLDRLTDILKNKHVILEAHGNIPFNLSRTFSDIEFNKIVEYNIETPWKNNTILIKPEEEKVLNLSEYQYLIDNWKYIKDIIIIGYSFSKFENQIDDYYSLQLIIELTKYYQNKVFLIDPNPEYTQYIIEEGIKKKITILPLKWSILSKVILKNIINRGLYMLCNKCDTIMTEYYRLYE